MKYQVGNYLIDIGRYRISAGDTAVPVEPKVFDLLVHLIRNRDRVLTREELFEQVWEGREVSDATLSNHVKSARKVLGDSGELQQTIQTIRGRGYQFIAAVKEVGDGAGDPHRPVPGPQPAPARPVWLMPLATAVLLLVAAGLFGWRYFGTADNPAQAEAPRLLTVPIEVAGADPATWQPRADELTRRVISDLRQISGLQVKDRATSFMFQGNSTHDHVRQQLPDVRYVLSGVLRIAANQAPSLTMELDDLGSSEQVWSKAYRFPQTTDDASLVEMQSTIAAAVSGSLRVTILEDEELALRRSRQPPTKNSEALALYVEGWKHLQLPDHQSLKKAVELFDRATALDDKFFDAWFAKGEAYRWLYANYETPRDVLPKVVAAFEKARDLRPESAEPLAALGLTYAMAWDWNKAWENLTAARQRDADLATTELGFAIYYCGLGEVDLMKKALYRARDNDPLNLELADWGNWALFLNGQTDASREWSSAMLEKHPAVGLLFQDAGISAYMAGDHARAIKLAERGRALEDSPMAKIVMAQAYGYGGQKEKVRPLLEAAASSGVYTCPYESAIGYLSIGDTDAVMPLLEQAYQKRSNCLIFLRVDPRLKPIRENPRYQAQYLDLLARVGLDDAKWKSYPR